MIELYCSLFYDCQCAAGNVLCTDASPIPCSVTEQDDLNDTASHAFSDYCSTVHTGSKTASVLLDI